MFISRELESAIRIASEDCGFSIREDYSGRGMFGKTCLGIVANNIGKAVAAILRNIDDPDVIEEFAGVLENLHTDSMGKSSIFYFPNFEFGETEDEDDWN